MSYVRDAGVFPAQKKLRCIPTLSERCVFSGPSIFIVKLQVISHLQCTVINLDRQKGREIDGPSVIASLVWQSKPWFCMQGMRPSWLCLQFKAVIHCVWGRSRISLGHVILLVHASGIFAAIWDKAKWFYRNWSTQVGAWCSAAQVGCLYHCCTHCCPKCSAKMIQQVRKNIWRVIYWELGVGALFMSLWKGLSAPDPTLLISQSVPWIGSLHPLEFGP